MSTNADTPPVSPRKSTDAWAQARQAVADIERVRQVPDSGRPDGVVSHPDFSGHKGFYLSNLEGFLGGRFPALPAERDRLVALLDRAEDALRLLSEGEPADYPLSQEHVEEMASDVLEAIDAELRP